MAVGPSRSATTPTSSSKGVNGEWIAGQNRTGGTLPGKIPPHVLSGSKPASPSSRPQTPGSTKSNLSPPASLPPTPSPTSASSRPSTPLGTAQPRLSPRSATTLCRPNVTGKPASPVPGSASNVQSKVSPKLGSTFQNHVIRPGTPTDTLSKANVANKRKRHAEATVPLHTTDADTVDSSPIQGTLTDAKKPKLDTHTKNGLVPGLSRTRSLGNFSSRLGDDSDTVVPKQNWSPDSVSSATAASERVSPGLSARRNATQADAEQASWAGQDTVEYAGSKSQQGRLEKSSSTAKVKTTAQLIQELHTNCGLRLGSSKTVTKIALNQIEKEPDIQTESVVPAGAKPRPRRKPGTLPPSSSDRSLSEAKSEMVQKFLQSSVAHAESEVDLLSLIKEDKGDSESREVTQPLLASEGQSNGLSESLSDLAVEVGTDQPQAADDDSMTDAADAQQATDPWSQLPPLDLDSINWEEERYDLPKPVTEPSSEIVTRLHSQNWTGVSGQVASDGIFYDWTQTYSTPTAGDNLLHVLPYVDIDD